METLQKMLARIAHETDAAYQACPFAFLSTDYFARFTCDPAARPAANEVDITSDWHIVFPPNADPLIALMAGHLQEFLTQRMGVPVAIEQTTTPGTRAIVLDIVEGRVPATSASFTLDTTADCVTVQGHDASGVRDGIVRLVALMGLRQAPMLSIGRQVYTPRVRVQLGAVPFHGTHRDLVFMGNNALLVGAESLFTLSTSEAIPELRVRRDPTRLDSLRQATISAQRYGLHCYAFIDIRQKFPADDPIFTAHPDIRGARTWKVDGEFVLCTEHPLVHQYLQESVTGLFADVPGLDGIIIIIGGEGFYHCYMRPYGVEKGHTNCPRCESMGADTVVANLCNSLAAAAHLANPQAEIIAWPYSAEHVWSDDAAQEGVIRKLKSGTAIFTEMEKDETLDKPEGVRKALWDYSIDLIGPGARAQRQIQLCREIGIPIFMKSEPELAFEAPRLPSVPCQDRWWDRAEAMAACGADGALVFPAFRPNYGTVAAELYQYAWWTPVPEKTDLLARLAARVAGPAAGPHLQTAWQHVSTAIPWSPELPSYYNGPYYLGPAHPMCADPTAPLPHVFHGYYFFYMEITDADGAAPQPTFVTAPTGDVPVFGRYYQQMAAELQAAVEAVERAAPLVPARCRLTFDAEASSIRWFYHTARTEANFYASCQMRDQIRDLVERQPLTPEQKTRAQDLLARWRTVLQDERDNAFAALPLVQADMRLDWYYGGDHNFPHGTEMLEAKLALLELEIATYLPSRAQQLGVELSLVDG
ncbi:MAG: hypothetical protein ACYDBB_02820 [Armatimonadota bacterium]